MTECKGTHPGTAIFAVRADGSFLLVKRAKAGAGLGKWSVPGGRVERGETWQDTSRRELLEETCLVITGRLELLTATTTQSPEASDGEASDGEIGWLTVWSMGRCERRPVVLNEEGSEYAWVRCGDLWRYELWRPHWVPLLSYYGGTTVLDAQLQKVWA